MQFAGDLPGFFFVLQQPNLKEGVFQGWGVDGYAAESIYVGLRFPGAVLHGEVVLLQGG